MMSNTCKRQQALLCEVEELQRKLGEAVARAVSDNNAMAEARMLGRQLEERIRECREERYGLSLRREIARKHQFVYVSEELPGGVFLAQTKEDASDGRNRARVIDAEGDPVSDPLPSLVCLEGNEYPRILSPDAFMLALPISEKFMLVSVKNGSFRTEVVEKNETLLRFSKDGTPILQDGRSGQHRIFDKATGEFIPYDQPTDCVLQDFSEDAALVWDHVDGDATYRFTDKSGKELFSEYKRFKQAREFSEGKAAVQVEVKSGPVRDQFYVFIDRAGNEAFNGKFASAQSFSEGLAAVNLRGSRHWIYIDSTGARAFSGGYAEARPFSSGCAWVNMSGEGWQLIDRQGRVVVKGDPIDRHLAPGMQDGIVPVRIGPSQFKLYGRDGKQLSDEEFNSVAGWRGGIARAFKNGKLRSIDAFGNEFPYGKKAKQS